MYFYASKGVSSSCQRPQTFAWRLLEHSDRRDLFPQHTRSTQALVGFRLDVLKPSTQTQHCGKMVKIAAVALAVLAGSASAFAPSAPRANSNVVLNAEKSTALPFMNRPPLVS